MNSKERVLKTLKFEEVDRFPRSLWFNPGIAMFHKDELDRLLKHFPLDFGPVGGRVGVGKRTRGEPYVAGQYTDAWGCVWHVGETGVLGEVKESPIKEWEDLEHYEFPWEIIRDADLSDVNRTCASHDRFTVAWTDVRPFERMQYLRGVENLFMDLAYGEREVYRLRDRLHAFFLKEIEMWVNTDVDAVFFMDDWGTQKTLLISPELWRQFYKPLYKDYCDLAHSKGKYVFFHSDGNIESIYPDLVEIGINAVNSQLFCMDMEKLGDLYAGKIAFWGEIDRQFVLPFGTENEVRNAVQRVTKAVAGGKRTGLIAHCEWGMKNPGENIWTVFDEWAGY